MPLTFQPAADGPTSATAASIKFNPGTVVATPGALKALKKSGCLPLTLLSRHLCGDWGNLPPEDAKANDDALLHGDRLLSAYNFGGDARIWVITEADRSVTTFLLPSEY